MLHVPAPERPPQPGRPYLVASRPPVRRNLLVLWHLFSLDAPTVAACWTVFIAWSASVRLPWTDPAAMFLAVWILYAADRLLDAQPLFDAPFSPELRERHHFHHRHRRRLLPALTLLAIPLAFLLHRTAEAVLHLDILLACLLASWLLLVHARAVPSAGSHRLPKELAVGFFFPAAVFIPTVARAPGLRSALLGPAAAFGCVCALNCLFLYAWEHPDSCQHAAAHVSTRTGVRHLRSSAWFVASITGLLACIAGRWQPLLRVLPHGVAVYAACSLSTLLLLGLHRLRHRIAAPTLRALADLVLLSPVVLQGFLHLVRQP